MRTTEVKAVHVADPPKLRLGTGADDDPMEVEISKDMTAPKITYGPEAHFSAKARRKKEECTVGINLTVTKEGTTRDMLVTDSCPDLDANAMKDGQPVAVRVTIQVGFTIY